MRNQTQQNGQTGQREPRQPTHDVKVKRQGAEKATYERIGAAWQRDDGTFFVKLHGTQIVSEGFSIYPIDNDR